MGNRFQTLVNRALAEGLPKQEEIELFGADGEEVICRMLCENFDKVIRNVVVPHKELYLEKVLRFTYVLSTVACIVTGVMMIFGVTHFESRYYSNTTWYGFYGIGLAIGGTIALRLVYEGIMMALLLVRNVMEINSKLKAPKDPEQAEESTEE